MTLTDMIEQGVIFQGKRIVKTISGDGRTIMMYNSIFDGEDEWDCYNDCGSGVWGFMDREVRYIYPERDWLVIEVEWDADEDDR